MDIGVVRYSIDSGLIGTELKAHINFTYALVQVDCCLDAAKLLQCCLPSWVVDSNFCQGRKQAHHKLIARTFLLSY